MIDKQARANILKFSFKPINELTKLKEAIKLSTKWIRSRHPKAKLSKVELNLDDVERHTAYVTTNEFAKILVPMKRVRKLDTTRLAKLLSHEQGHSTFDKKNLYKNKEFLTQFKGKVTKNKNEWNNSYPSFSIPKLWRKDYIDYLGKNRLQVPGYATKHPEEEYADIFAALSDPTFKVKIPKGTAGERLKKKIQFVYKTNK